MKNYVGIDIGGTKMYMVYIAPNGEVIENQVPTGKNVTVSYIRNEISKFTANLGQKPDAIGIAVPGLVKDNTLIRSDVLDRFSHVRGTDLSPEYKSYLINDVRAATIFEVSQLKNDDSAIVVMVGTGIACGLYTNHNIICGANGFAGELGSTKIHDVTGNLKTLDELASGAAIIKNANMTIDEIIKRLEMEDQQVTGIIRSASYYLGIAISNLISVFNPSSIVFGGSTITYRGYFDHMVQTINDSTLLELLEDCKLRITSNLKNIVALGAIANITCNE